MMNQIILLLICTVFGIGFGLISDLSEKLSVVFSTAFGGAYMIVKGVGILLKNYPDEITIAQRIQMHEFEEIPRMYYFYIMLMAILGTVGSIVQLKKIQEENPNTEIEDNIYLDSYRSIDKNDISIDVTLGAQEKSRNSKKSTHPRIKLN